MQAAAKHAKNNNLSGGDYCGRYAWAQGPIANTQQFYPRDFNLFTLGGGVNSLRDTHGPIAANGDISISYFHVNLRNQDPVALVAQGSVRLGNGTVVGSAHYGTRFTASNVTFVDATAPTTTSTPINFTAAATKLTDMSTAVNRYTAIPATKQYSTVTFTGTDPELNVFSIASSQLAGTTSYSFNVPAGSAVIINVSGTAPSITNAGFSGTNGLPSIKKILWNFPDATTLTLSSVGFLGSILAPKAAANFNNGAIDGTVVVKSATPCYVELHAAPYQVPSSGGCLALDPTWSCSGDTPVDDDGRAATVAAEAGFIELKGGTYVAEGATRTSPKNRVWYSFHPADKTPKTKPLAVFFNGGPGSSTMAYLFSFNTAPWTLDPQLTGSQQIVGNPTSWTQFANVLHIDAPGAGFSYPLPLDDGSKPSVGIDIDRDAGMFLRLIVRFLARHPSLLTNPVLIVGESYGGTRAPLMLDYLYNYPDLSGTTAAYRDSDLASDLNGYFATVFSTQTPTAAQIATKFGKQVLIQPAVAGNIQWALNGGQDKSVCLSSSYDDYFCDHASGWSDQLITVANENLMRIPTLTRALGVNPTTIEWMKATSRTQAYGRTGDQVVSAPEMVATFGTLVAGDNYFLSHNSEVGNGYVVSTTPTTVYSRSWYGAGASIGASFLRVLQNVTTFITNSKFDTVVWTPAIPPALEDPVFSSVVSSVTYSPTQSNGLDRPGLVTVTYTSGARRVFPLPLYNSGHTVPMRAPADILADVKKWYVSPPLATAFSATSSMDTDAMSTPTAAPASTPATPPVPGERHPYIGP